MSSPEPIAIVGMQCLFPGAASLEAYWRNICRGVEAVGDIPPSRWDPDAYDLLHARRGGFLEGLTAFDPLDHGIMPAAAQHGDPEQFLVFGVVHGALRDMARGKDFQISGVARPPGHEDEPWPQRTEVIVGRGGYNGNIIESAYLRMEFVAQAGALLGQLVPGVSKETVAEMRRLLTTAWTKKPSTEVLASSIPNLTSGRISNRLDFMGANYNVDAACASGLVATDLVMRSLRERRCDLGIAAAVQLVQKPYFWYAFELLQALSPTGSCRPYSKGADGLVIGEGMGAVILKRLDDARRDGDRVYAILRGVGTASDGKAMGVLAPRREGQVLAIQRAYEDTGVDPKSIRLVEGHGTAMQVGDATEIQTLHEVFGQDGHPAVALGSVKSMLGHLMPAAGMAGLIKTALAVHHRVLPPTIGVEEVHPALAASRFYVNTKLRPWVAPVDAEPRRAGVNAFGFGGINTHAILEDVPGEQPRESLTPRSCELFTLSAATRAGLDDKLGTWLAALPGWRGEELRDVCYTAHRRFGEHEPVRVSIVASDIGDLEKKLTKVRDRLRRETAASWHDDAGLAFAEGPYGGKLAVLFPGLAFPGLAAGYTERLGELCLHFPEARWNLDFAESYAGTVDPTVPYPLSHQFFPPPLADAKTLAKLERELIWSKRTSLAQLLVALGTWDLLCALGIKADALAGFSLGEWGALVASGVLSHDDLRDMMTIWQSLGDVPEQLTGLWGMVGTSAERVEAVLERVPGVAAIIMDPSPTQTFFAGEAETVRLALDLLRKEGVFVQEIPFPAIHTPLANSIVDGLRSMKAAMPANPPKRRVYCGMNGQPYPDDPDTIRDWLIDSFKEPLRGKDTLRNLYHHDGIRVFIEVGIGGRMAGGLGRILEGAPHVALAVDSRGQGGLDQLHQLLGRLVVLGVPFDAGYLYRRRPCKDLDLGGPAKAASRTELMLDLSPPKARVPEESVERLRELIAPAAEVREPEPVRELAAVGQPTGVLGEIMATMQQFLQVQEQQEAAEAQLLTNFLATQQVAMGRFLQAGPALVGGGGGSQARGEASANPQAGNPQPAHQQLATKYPFVGEVVKHVPGRELETRLVLDIDEHVFLIDHSFIHQVPLALRPVEERLPTLPMTFGMELIAEVAATLAPGMQVLATHDVEASKWIALVSQRRLPLRLKGRRLSETEVDAVICTEDNDRPALRGKVTLGPALPPAPTPRLVDAPQPCDHRAEELYSIPFLFHGPRFHVVTKLVGTSDTTMIAELTLRDPSELLRSPLSALPIFDPVLADGIGQVVGYKLLHEDWVTYPLRLGRLSRFGPVPPPGSVVRLHATYKRLDGRRVQIDADVLDPAGRVWLRLENWQVWRILWPRELAIFSRQPRQNRVGIAWPTRNPAADCCRMMATRFGEINPEWIARYCLPASEWATFQKKPGYNWMLRRIAIKDAVRDWLKQHRGEVLMHVEIEIADDADGQPVVVLPKLDGVAVAVGGVGDEAIALAVHGQRPGVDLASLKDDVAEAFTDDEQAVLSGREAQHRAASAKRALGVALRRPVTTILVRGIDTSGVVAVTCDGTTYEVETFIDNDHVFAAVTTPAAG